jgi:hypothetical protein
VATEELGEITDEAKGVLLSVVALGGDEAVLDGLHEPLRGECVAAFRALGRLEGGTREARLSAWRARAHSGLPAGLQSLHPSWIEAALAGEPAYLRRHLQGRLPQPLRAAVENLMTDAAAKDRDLGIGPKHSREIERLAFGHLDQLCEGACGPLAATLCALDFEALQAEVTRRGARTLGRSLAGTDAIIQARAMSLAGQPWATAMAEALGESLTAEQRMDARKHASGNVHASSRTAAERLQHIGLAALKSELEGEGVSSVFRVAGRLPVELGRRLLSE